MIVYPSGRLVIVRELSCDIKGDIDSSGASDGDSGSIKAFVYRGHTAPVTVAKFSPSGCYVASGDARGKLRVWSYDNEEHLCKLDLNPALGGAIRDISWDVDSKRLCIVGDGSKFDSSSPCTKVIQWDTGVKCGDLAQHSRGRASSCSFKPNRPMRIVTGGGEDSKCLFNAGPPFARVTTGVPTTDSHTRGAIHCIRYNPSGTKIASVGTDKSVCIYDGKTMELTKKIENVHDASIYSCAWDSSGQFLLTCSADGTTRLICTDSHQEVHRWDVASFMTDSANMTSDKVPIGAMQMACAFVDGDVPVSVALNGTISLLPTNDRSFPSEISSSSDTQLSKVKFLTGHQSPISALAIDNDKGQIMTGDSDGVICTWTLSQSGTAPDGNVQRMNTGEDENSLDLTLMNKVHSGAITGMVVYENELLSIGWDDKIRITQDKTMTRTLSLESQPNKIAKGNVLVVILTVSGILLVRDTNTIDSELIPTNFEPISVCISSDDSTVYVGGNDCNIHVYTVKGDSLEKTHTLSGHGSPVSAVCLSNSETYLASADSRDICIWNVNDNYSIKIGRSKWCFHRQRINALSWSKDDDVLASGGNDDSIYIWSLKKTIKRIHYAFAHRGGIVGISFRDGYQLLSVGNDGCINQWDLSQEITCKFK